MSKVKVQCKDGFAEVSCISPLFTKTTNVHNGPTVAELEGVDIVFASIKNMSPAESTMMIMSMGLPKVLRLKEISSSLGIMSVLRATEAALNNTFKSLDNPGASRELFNIANDFDPLENKILLETFSALLT